MPGCNCPGQSCGCAIQAGSGVRVAGVGTAKNPFVVSLDNAPVTIDQTAAGALDLSSYSGDRIITVNLQQNATSVILPNAPGTRLELLVVTPTVGRTVTWPAGIRWAGGNAPAAIGTAGKANWVALHQAAGFWVGALLGVV